MTQSAGKQISAACGIAVLIFLTFFFDEAPHLHANREFSIKSFKENALVPLDVAGVIASASSHHRFTASKSSQSCLQILVSEQLTKGNCKLGQWHVEIKKSSKYADFCTFALDESTLEVLLSGTAHAFVPLTCDGTSCLGLLDIRDPGQYELHVRIAEFVELSSYRSFQCFSRKRQQLFLVGGTSPLKLKFTALPPEPDPNSIAISSNSVIQKMNSAVATSTSGEVRSSSSGCHPSSFYSGRWLRRKTQYSMGKIAVFSWEPYEQCDWPAFWEREKLQHVLRSRWILFIGDSTMEELAFHLSISIFGRFDSSWNKFESRARGTFRSSRYMDTGYSPNGTRLSFLWGACPIPRSFCNFGGASTVLNGTFQLYLSSLLKGKRPDVLVYNTGLHDLAHYWPLETGFTMRDYEHDLEAALSYMSKVADLRIWKATSLKSARFECAGVVGGRKGGGTRGDVIRMNRLAGSLARRHGFVVADQTSVNEGLAPWLPNWHGHHCEDQVPCTVFALSYYNFFQYYWAQAAVS